MSFVSVLKKIGLEALNVANVATTVIPILQPFAGLLPKGVQDKVNTVQGVTVDKLGAIVNLVQQVEVMGAAANAAGTSVPGSVKAAQIAPFVSGLFQDIEILSGKKIGGLIKDQAKFNAAMQTIAGAVADALNACGD